MRICRFYFLKCLTFIILLISGVSYAQNFPYSSADGTALIRSIQNSVNYATGTLNVQIPLYTVTAGDISVPIGISYQATGLKVGDTTTRVGMGWRLFAGGQIIRIVKGRASKDNTGALYPVFFYMIPIGTSIDNLTYEPYTSLSNPDSALNAAYHRFFDNIPSGAQCDYMADLEPDMFYFEIPGRSGLFIMDAAGEKGYTIPYQYLTIEAHSGYDNTQQQNYKWFSIIDEKGTRYVFQTAEYTKENRTPHPSNNYTGALKDAYYSTWYLNSIESLSGKRVTFDYSLPTKEIKKRVNYIYNFTYKNTNTSFWGGLFPEYGWAERIEEDNIITETSRRFLTNIKTSEETVTFTGNLLNTIMVKRGKSDNGNEKIIEEFLFGYQKLGFYQFLTTLQLQSGYNSMTQSICSFTYDTTYNLPAWNSNDFDWWGYYNGANNSKTDYCPNHVQEILNGLPVYVGTANRDMNGIYVKTNILTSIKYPTGSQIEYVYEPNKTSTYETSGVRIEQIKQISETGKTEITSYGYQNNNNGDKWVNLSNIVYGRRVNILFNYYVSAHPLNQIFDIDGSTICYYHEVTETHPDGSKTVYAYDDLGGSDSTYFASKSMYYIASDKPNYIDDNELRAPHNPVFWRRKQLISVTQQNKDGLQVSKQVYKYKSPNSLPVEFKMNGYVSDIIFQNPFESAIPKVFQYTWISQPVLLDYVETIQGPSNQYSKTVYEYDPNTFVPTRITVIDSEGTRRSTIIKYPFDYIFSKNTVPSDVDIPAYALVQLQQTGVVVPIEQVTTVQHGANGTEHVTSGSQNEFRCYIPKYNPYNTYSIILPYKSKALRLKDPISIQEKDLFRYSIYNDSLFKTVETTDNYDAITYSYTTPEGNNATGYDMRLLSRRDENDREVSYIYPVGYGVNEYHRMMPPIGEVVGAKVAPSSSGRLNQAFHTSFEENLTGNIATLNAKTGNNVHQGVYTINLSYFAAGSYLLSYWQSSDSGATWNRMTQTINITTQTSYNIGGTGYWIDEVRLMPANARMTTCTYSPQGNVTSKTDENGQTTYYKYDALGRLIEVRDNERNLLKSTEYSF